MLSAALGRAILFAFTLTATCQAGAEPLAVCGRPTVMFVNGVWNSDPADVDISARALKAALSETGLLGPSSYNLAAFWNPGDGVIDIYEVFFAARASQTYEQALATANSRFANSMRAVSQTFDNNVARLERELDTRIGPAPLVVVAHSQGNNLTNRAVTSLLAKRPELMKRLSVVGVAVADSTPPPGNYRYITNTTDLIINGLRIAQGALVGNFGFDLAVLPGAILDDPTQHAFRATYLSKRVGIYKGEPASPQIAVAQLTRDAFDQIRCLPTQMASDKPGGVSATVGVPATLKVGVTADTPPGFGRVVAGSVSFIDSEGKVLCSSNVAAGEASCAATFGGPKRVEAVSARFSGTGGYIDSTLVVNVDVKPNPGPYVIEFASTLDGDVPRSTLTTCSNFSDAVPGVTPASSICRNAGTLFIGCVGKGCIPLRFSSTVLRREFTWLYRLPPPYAGDPELSDPPLIQYGSNEGIFSSVPVPLTYPTPVGRASVWTFLNPTAYVQLNFSGVEPYYSELPFIRYAGVLSGTPPADRGLQVRGYHVKYVIRIYDTYLDEYIDYPAEFDVQ